MPPKIIFEKLAGIANLKKCVFVLTNTMLAILRSPGGSEVFPRSARKNTSRKKRAERGTGAHTMRPVFSNPAPNYGAAFFKMGKVPRGRIADFSPQSRFPKRGGMNPRRGPRVRICSVGGARVFQNPRAAHFFKTPHGADCPAAAFLLFLQIAGSPISKTAVRHKFKIRKG